MTKKTTPEERRKFIEEQRAAGDSHYSPNRRLPVDMSFIDREGNIVRPSKDSYQYNVAFGLNKRYDSLISKYGKDSKQVYQFETEHLGMHRKGKPSKLEGGLAIIGLLGAGLFFYHLILLGM